MSAEWGQAIDRLEVARAALVEAGRPDLVATIDVCPTNEHSFRLTRRVDDAELRLIYRAAVVATPHRNGYCYACLVAVEQHLCERVTANEALDYVPCARWSSHC